MLLNKPNLYDAVSPELEIYVKDLNWPIYSKFRNFSVDSLCAKIISTLTQSTEGFSETNGGKSLNATGTIRPRAVTVI